MNRLSKRHFWEWFKRCNKEYLNLNKKPRKEASYWLNELNAHLRAYFKFFGFNMELENNQSATLTITVNGKAVHFAKVDAFVALAPDIPGWTITALQSPMPVDFLLEQQMELTGIAPEELCFSLESGSTSADIIVYHPLCTQENKHVFSQLVHAAVYNLLGERSYGVDVGRVEVANLSLANPKDLRDLEELPGLLGSGRSSMTVDNKGMLIY